MQWENVCNVADLQENSGICALVNGLQVAIFYIPEIKITNLGLYSSPVYAIGNYDPIGKANVLSRGVVGDINGQIVVASPLYKQHFNLETGVCLENKTVTVPIYACRIDDDIVQVDTRPVSLLEYFVAHSSNAPQNGVAL